MKNEKKREKEIKLIMEVEHCDRSKAIRFLELRDMILSDDFTPEIGKQIYKELEELRK